MNLIDIVNKNNLLYGTKFFRNGKLVLSDITDKNSVHSYLPLYQDLLEPIQNSAKNILEIGVASGGSIRMWYDFFINANIFGCDIVDYVTNKNFKDNSRVFLNLKSNAYSNFFVKKFIDRNIKFDFLLDDGPHTLESQIIFIQLYSQLLSDKGILIIEDVQDISWFNILENNTPNNLKKYIRIYDLRKNKNRYDDLVFTIDKLNL